jgi:hypothetical protein
VTVAVLVRVHHRMADLEICVRTIRRRWTDRAYEVLVVSNGTAVGIPVPDAVRRDADVVEVAANPGHLAGNALLLREGLSRLSGRTTHVVLLEADTWLFSDLLVSRYLERMTGEGAVWASAAWLDRYDSLALDFAVADIAFLREHPRIFAFDQHPESHVAEVLDQVGGRYLWIEELMPVHVPRILRRLIPDGKGRFRSFPEGPMVTHHVEDLPGGLLQKMQEANIATGRMEFDVAMNVDPARARQKLVRLRRLARLAPRSAWVRRRRRRSDRLEMSRTP